MTADVRGLTIILRPGFSATQLEVGVEGEGAERGVMVHVSVKGEGLVVVVNTVIV